MVLSISELGCNTPPASPTGRRHSSPPSAREWKHISSIKIVPPPVPEAARMQRRRVGPAAYTTSMPKILAAQASPPAWRPCIKVFKI